ATRSPGWIPRRIKPPRRRIARSATSLHEWSRQAPWYRSRRNARDPYFRAWLSKVAAKVVAGFAIQISSVARRESISTQKANQLPSPSSAGSGGGKGNRAFYRRRRLKGRFHLGSALDYYCWRSDYGRCLRKPNDDAGRYRSNQP